MSTKATFILYLLISLLFIPRISKKLFSQNNITGTWEGNFMADFKTRLTITESQNQYTGNIKMFAGENTIQDDQLSKIYISENRITFLIPAKESLFEGSFDDQMNELSGNFVFPDGTEHPIQLKKNFCQSNSSEEYYKLKGKQYSGDQLIADMNFIYSRLKEYHPQLYAFTTEESMNILLDELNSKIDSSLTLDKFYMFATTLTDNVHCSHTGIKLPANYQNLANNQGNFFPLQLFFTDQKAFYISGLPKSNNQLLPGNEIISLNDKPMNEIITQLFYFIPSEGNNLTTKYNEINKNFNALFYFLDDSNDFRVKFKKGESYEILTVHSTKSENLKRNNLIERKSKQVDFYYRDNPKVGVLQVTSFAIPNMEEYFHQLDSIFADLKTTNTHNLVLDLRDNPGGHPIFAAQLLSYLVGNEFIYFKRNKDIVEFEPLYNTMQPNELHFDGNLYVFINGGCLSTTGHLISLLKYNSDAIFIGEEPGSTFRCNDYSMQFKLPNTGLELNIPRTTFETAVEGFSINEPFPIDYETEISVGNVINYEDTYFELLSSIIEK